jgi:hypothetical protein
MQEFLQLFIYGWLVDWLDVDEKFSTFLVILRASPTLDRK